MSAGDTIIVRSVDTMYIYMVASVEKDTVASGAGIPLEVPSPRLTIATCNSFGVKGDRFIVTAVLVERRALSK